MKIAIMQPYIFPYIGYFQLIKSVDTFVFYDDVNFIKRGWINRNKILINGKESLISFPCLKASQNTEIRKVGIELADVQYKKILKTISCSYKKAPFYNDVFPIIQNCLESDCQTISELAIQSVTRICNYIGLRTKSEISSQKYPQTKNLEKADRLIEITKLNKAEKYNNSIGGQELYAKQYFKSHNVDLQFLQPVIKEYKQFDNVFVPELSIIDVLMFNSIENTNRMINDYDLI